MPIPINRLKSEHKLDEKSLKAAFANETMESRPKVKKLVETIRDTIQNGIRRNRGDYRLFKAMDWSFDSPFYQVSYTQLRGLISSAPDEKKVLEAVNSWGLTHLLPDVLNADGTCCQENGKPKKALNLPVFFNIFVPIVMSYITIRWAKLFNDRNLVPLYKYEPVTFTRENRVRCEILTQMVQRQATWFDYPADLKQSILQTLLYGFCINFPREAWYVERQEDEEGKVQIVREGLRWNMPHPSRTYYDLYHRMSSLNSNSGCEYAGYWELCRYRDIHDNPLYWNKDKITMGSISWFDLGNTPDFLAQVFPCAMSFPDGSGLGAGGVGALDRQNEAARTYGNGDFDNATLLTQHFHKLVPKDYGLGTYQYPIWMRFVYASDSAVVWAEPLAMTTPTPTYTYDADFNRARFRSLALEIMPFQDHISNVLTQWILAVKDNLTNPVFYDKEKIPANYVKELQNLGQKILNGRMFIPFSSTENYRFKVDQREAFYSPNLTHHPTGELQSLVSGIISMLDRMMQLSPQEVGQAAAHEQTAEETRVIATNTSTRVTFTGTGIDSADNAKKTALYEATMAHADDDIQVGITSSFASTKEEFDKLLTAVGFKLSDTEAGFDPDKPEMMHPVKGRKTALAIDAFSSTRDNTNRINLPAVADAMSKIFIAVANNPVLIQAIGPQQLVELLNQIIISSGVPQEFRLRGKALEEQPQEQQAQQLAEMMKQFAAQIQQLVAQKQQETIAAAGQQTQQIVGQALQAVQQQTAQVVAQGQQQAAAALQQAAPALQAAQEAAQAGAQKIAALEQSAVAQQQEIDSLNQAVTQLTEAVQQASQMAGGVV
jgi:hypothetical protein